MTTARNLVDYVDRSYEGIACECGGYCDLVKPTEEEDKQYGCRGRKFCCSRAFVCRICATRWLGKAEPPAADWEG